VQGNNRITYRELNEGANRLAWGLGEMGVSREDRIALCLERGVEMIVSVLGVLKAGAGYVPLDPGYPQERLQFMVADCEPKLIVTEGALQGRVSASRGMEVIVLDADEFRARLRRRSSQDVYPGEVGVTERSLAYVIYTSGSTGVPKGVMVEHKGLCNLAVSLGELFAIKPESRVLQFSSFSFDGSTWDWLMALCYGASLYFEAREDLYPGPSLKETMQRDGITHVTMVASAATATFVEGGIEEGLALIVTGEPCTVGLAKAGSRGGRLFNVYGPTETTICTTTYRCGSEEGMSVVPVGRPMPNTRVYVLDDRLQLVGVGVVGEIYIGGMGVSRGYRNREELTTETLLADPFAGCGGRMYKTGDLGRWQANGELEFLGRADDQVKVRGYRIELGEVEAVLVRCAGVKEATVAVQEGGEGGEKMLVGYYTVQGEGEGEGEEGEWEKISAQELSAAMRRELPEYMVPAAYVRLERIPMTPNGKVDRRGLPMPEAEAYARAGYEEPQGEIEQELAGIWAELLKVERVSRHDNFFNLGGHSLLAVRMMNAISLRCDVGLAVQDVFRHPVLKELGEKIELALLESFDAGGLLDLMGAMKTR